MGASRGNSGNIGCMSAGERAPLSGVTLAGALVRPGGFWRAVEVTGVTGSTNADLLERAAGGAPEGTVLVAEAQTSGRGRMGRAWVSRPGAALTFSALLRPVVVPPARRGWIPLLAGVAIASAVAAAAGLDARLKWPNDVLVGGRKLAGILAEQAAGAVVVGVGLNVSARRDELPIETATSLALEGAAGIGRQQLLGGLRRDAQPAGHVLAVDDHERRLVALAQQRQAVEQCVPAEAADEIADEQDRRLAAARGRRALGRGRLRLSARARSARL